MSYRATPYLLLALGLLADESNALRLPPDADLAGSTAADQCLETPPAFSGSSRPGRRNEQPSAQPPAEPAEQSEEPPDDPDRAIDN
jgi:hypothetical protein